MKKVSYKRENEKTLLKTTTTTIKVPISRLKHNIEGIDRQISRININIGEELEWVKRDRLKIKKLQKEKRKIMKLIKK